jgi:hypothetical protein
MEHYDDAAYIIGGFKSGFSLGLIEEPRLKAYSKLLPAKPSLAVKVDDEVVKGRIVGPFSRPPIADLMISPACTIPKPNSDKVRMIFNLSHPPGHSVNDNIKEESRSVRYCSVAEVARWLLHNDPEGDMFLAKVDLTDAYRMVPVKKEEWRFLGMRVGADIYIDRCLPMGAASSCQIFQRISDGIAWMATTHSPVRCKIFNYLDDFLIMANSQAACTQALDSFAMICRHVGITLAPHKTVGPCQDLVFLGIGIDAKNHRLLVPPEKASRTLDQLQHFLQTSRPRVVEWQKILGKLSFLTQVISAGKPFLSSVYGSLRGILSQDHHKRRRVNHEVREDLEVWVSFLQQLPSGKQFKMLEAEPAKFSIATDASATVGFGCTCGTLWFAGRWPSVDWHAFNIALLELYPIYAALHLWTEKFADSVVNVYTDNRAVVDVIQKLYTKDKQLRRLLKPITLTCLSHNIRLIAHHIPGRSNIGPDLLSRGKVAEFLRTFPGAQQSPIDVPHAIAPSSLLQILKEKECSQGQRLESQW